jgi:hypothetical protein
MKRISIACAALSLGALLGGCAAGPYYDNGYYGAPYYDDSAFYPDSVVVEGGFVGGDGHEHHHDRFHDRDHDHDHDRGDRGHDHDGDHDHGDHGGHDHGDHDHGSGG